LAESENSLKTDLLDMVLEVIQGQRGQSINELISLLALSNLLGIISFLNTQELKYEVKSSQSKSSTSELKEMAATLLASMGTGDKKNKSCSPDKFDENSISCRQQRRQCKGLR